MNFREFEELINSGEEKIVLTEDVVAEDFEKTDYMMGIDINADNIIIDGDCHIIDAKGKVSIFYVKASNVTLKNICFKDGFCEYSGGAIYNKGDLTIVNCRFTGNCCEDFGGAVYTSSGLTITSSVFSKNKADYGGAVYVSSDSTLKVEDTVFDSNTSEFEGGAIYNKSRLRIYGSLFRSNASFKGGAIYNGDIMNVRDCEFEKNIASDGDHIETENEDNLTVCRCSFIG